MTTFRPTIPPTIAPTIDPYPAGDLIFRADGGADFDAIGFMEQAQGSLSQLNGLELSGEAVESIKCYLTGEACPDGTFSIRKLAIEDKHGLRRNAFNAKVNIHRRGAAPILLGIEDRQLREDSGYSMSTTQLIRATRIEAARAGD